MKIVLIGAGSAQFGLGMLGDIFQSEVLSGSQVVLVDINEAALVAVQQKADEFLLANPLPFTVTSTLDRKAALSGSDVVVIAIEVGNRFVLWQEDWTIAQQYGIRQIYGENGGAGGVFHALRIIPPILEICADVASIAPSAWVFNFSNPMTAITTTVKRAYPDLRFVGLCHEVASLERYLPTILDTPFDNLILRSGGLNHFSVLLSARYKDTGADAYPDILAKAPAFFEQEPGYSDLLAHWERTGKLARTEGAINRDVLGIERSSKSWADRTLFKCFLDTYQLLPITSDSHIGEYISWAGEMADHKGIKDFFTLYQVMLSQARPAIELKQEERLVSILEGLSSDEGYEESAVNIMNTALIEPLPASIAVEVPAWVSRRGIEGIALKGYPKGFAALLNAYSGVYDLTAEAILTGRKQYVIEALLASPVVSSYRGIAELVDLMIERQRRWLGYLV
jgi:alpha-galactosidase